MAGVLMIIAGLVWVSYSPNGGVSLRDEDDGSREINLIALASNDSLAISVIVHSSVRGRVLQIPADAKNDLVDVVNDNSWDRTITISKGENLRISVRAWVFAREARLRGEKDTWTRCRIVDNGDRKVDQRRSVEEFRTAVSVECAYIAIGS
jgi:hypothetical protein